MQVSKKERFTHIIEDLGGMEHLSKNPYIAAENVTRDFDFEEYIIRAVDNVTVEISYGEYVAITGPSGAGKTTLLYLLAGLDRPTKGTIRLSYVDITPMQEETLATFRIFTTGMIFQTYNLISSLTALENVMFPLQLSGMLSQEAEKIALKKLEEVGLEERIEHLPFQLSAGEQQRVAIARALANDPPIIFADEPTANLDQENAEYIAKLFGELRKRGKTVVIVTHDEKLLQHAERILFMHDGKIIKEEIKETASSLPPSDEPKEDKRKIKQEDPMNED